jgi:hypothetical protein
MEKGVQNAVSETWLPPKSYGQGLQPGTNKVFNGITYRWNGNTWIKMGVKK